MSNVIKMRLRKIVNFILRLGFILIMLPLTYGLFALIFTYTSVNDVSTSVSQRKIFLSTNGIHLDLIFPVNGFDSAFLYHLNVTPKHRYVAFGWGDKNFYTETPTWKDLTLKTTVLALFLKSDCLMHVTRYAYGRKDWTEVLVTEKQFQDIKRYVVTTFKTNEGNRPIELENKGYSYMDDFYEANGSYTLFNTCNTWVNTGLKQNGVKACLWTPFDFGLIYHHK